MTAVATRVLFDTPGPRGRRRIFIGTVVSLVAIAGIVWFVFDRLYAEGQLAPRLWEPFLLPGIPKFIATGLLNTLKVAAVAALFAFPLGALFALMRLARNRLARWFAVGYVEIFRSTPLLLLVYMFVLALPPLGINLPVFWKITIPVILCNIALLAEVFRAGVLALPRGQTEAALAVGLSYWQSMRLVVMPQALRIVLPALVTQLVSLLKDSTLGFAASFPELMKTAENISARYQNFLPAYLVIALVFIAINLALSYFARALERFLARGRRGSARERDEVEAMESIEGDLPNLTMR
jgi:glutamate transport system permease protein